MSFGLTFMASTMALAKTMEDALLPPTTPDCLAKLAAVEEVLLTCPQLPLRTEHILHGGMYARTVRLAPGTVITGALIKVPTMLVVSGHCKVLVGEDWGELVGYNVFPASAGRKQAFVALEPTIITMLFPTQAQTVEEAEREFTDQHEQLLSRQSTDDTVLITGE